MQSPYYYLPTLGILAIGLIAVLATLRLNRFWTASVLSVVGAVLVFWSAAHGGDDSDIDNLVLVPGWALIVVGLGLATFLRQRRGIGLGLALLGAYCVCWWSAPRLGGTSGLWFWAYSGVAALVAAFKSESKLAPAFAVLAIFSGAGAPDVLDELGFGGHLSWAFILELVVAVGACIASVNLPSARWSRFLGFAGAALIACSVSHVLYQRGLDERAGETRYLSALASAAGVVLIFFGLARQKLFAWPGGGEASPKAVASGGGGGRRAAKSAKTKAARPTAQPGAATDVFISYKREERARVEAIAQALRDLKLSVWFDARLQSGKSFDDEINREVRNAKCVLVCWSKAAVDSEWVRAEATVGRQRGVLTACFLERCDPYPPFNLVHAEDLSAGALDGSNPAWAKIVDQIGHLAARPGLGAYVVAQHRGDKASFGAWIADNAHDPLADAVLARLRQA
jgi:hypothetical protein